MTALSTEKCESTGSRPLSLFGCDVFRKVIWCRVLHQKESQLELGGVLVRRQEGDALFRALINQIGFSDDAHRPFSIWVKLTGFRDNALICDVVPGLHNRQDDGTGIGNVAVKQAVNCLHIVVGLFLIRDRDQARHVNDTQV